MFGKLKGTFFFPTSCTMTCFGQKEVAGPVDLFSKAALKCKVAVSASR